MYFLKQIPRAARRRLILPPLKIRFGGDPLTAFRKGWSPNRIRYRNHSKARSYIQEKIAGDITRSTAGE